MRLLFCAGLLLVIVGGALGRVSSSCDSCNDDPIPINGPLYGLSPYPLPVIVPIQITPVLQPQPVLSCSPCYFCGGYYNPPACFNNYWCSPACRQDILRRFNEPNFWRK